jgi:hypothetical protein
MSYTIGEADALHIDSHGQLSKLGGAVDAPLSLVRGVARRCTRDGRLMQEGPVMIDGIFCSVKRSGSAMRSIVGTVA